MVMMTATDANLFLQEILHLFGAIAADGVEADLVGAIREYIRNISWSLAAMPCVVTKVRSLTVADQ